MAFKVAQSKVLPWPVKVALPIADGKFETHQFSVLIKRQTDKEIDALQKMLPKDAKVAELPEKLREMLGWTPADDKPTPRRLTWGEHTALVYLHQCEGWSEITDEEDQPLPWTFDQLLNIFEGPDGMHFNRGLVKAMTEMRVGTPEALEKNS